MMVPYYLLKAISKICCILPRGVCELLGRVLGNLAWIFVPKRRKDLARSQIKMCLGVSEEEAARLAKASAVRFGPMLMEVLRFPVIRRHIDEYVRIEGLDKLQKGLALGRGCIIAAAHSGNWELMGGAFAQAGIPLVGVAMKQRSSAADRFINEYRTLIGMHITYKSGVREMFDMLRKGWAIGLIMDQDTSRHNGIILDFFGRPTNCVPGAARWHGSRMCRFSRHSCTAMTRGCIPSSLAILSLSKRQKISARISVGRHSSSRTTSRRMSASIRKSGFGSMTAGSPCGTINRNLHRRQLFCTI